MVEDLSKLEIKWVKDQKVFDSNGKRRGIANSYPIIVYENPSDGIINSKC